MKIKWLGHACFLLSSANGARVLTDPFDKSVGYALPQEEADIVAVSHNHFDHNYVNAVKGSFVKIDRPGAFLERGIGITGVAACHDDRGGAKRGPNIVFVFDIDGLRICHCGDLGHALTPEQAGKIGNPDVLLVPVGGTYTVDAEGACRVMRQLKPAVTIPMHYKTPEINFPIDGVDKFLAAAAGVSAKKAGAQEVEITCGNLAGMPGILVLNYK